ncbi:bifunctional diguanylate cyclase/phosphodiesterase [Candidatus Contendibacter odensensis]|uniref:cyclic-guanylate-specific phosphodiesterase n=1 Tax=Candidatus Contendobacter odensis Run_B_J11 TaxID=1400861 RepID=A0A7U7J2I0_9GAMM|nr:EAL domain-containing protein [Candidatus Contendobacter odensis]CDH43353.1 putative Diguanylate cyclase [Candidatus Contendobacter odensis Run_B_J11]
MRIAESRPMVSSWFSVPLTLVLGLGLTSALFLIEQQSIARYGLILPIGLLGTALLAWTLRQALVREAAAEVLAHERAAALHESELKFRRMLEEIPNISVQGYDQNRRVIFWNTASERLYGYCRDEALGRLLEDLIIPPPMRDVVIQAVGEWVAGGQPIPCSELELLRKDGSLVPVFSSHIMLTTDQNQQEMYCLDLDLSERKRIETALTQRDALLEVAALTAARLLREPDPVLAIASCFAQLGEITDVDRIYLFENHCCPHTGDLRMSQRHEWCAERVSTQIDNPELQNLSYEAAGFSHWREVLAANAPIAGLVRDLPASVRAMMESQEILSLLIVPISVHGEFWGFIGLDDCRRERQWTSAEQRILQNIAGNVGEAIARQYAETALQNSEDQFRRLADNMRDLVCQIDITGTILYASPSYRAVLGYDPQALLGRSIFAGVHPEDRETAIKTCQASLTQREAGRTEIRHQHANGDYLWLEVVGNPLCNPAGAVIGAVISSRDITERKQAEADLRLATQVFESSREAITVTAADTRILWVNRAFSDITGYSAAEAVGQTPRLLASGRHGRDFYQEMWRALTVTGRWQGEIWNRCKTGEIYPEWLGISAVHDPQGHLTHYVGIFSDLSEHKARVDQIEFLAHHDPLTALPNRLLLQDRLDQALSQAERSQSSVALLLLDLDRFKLVNDSLGHALGDQLLQKVAMRLHQMLRDTDTLSRQGSDEFMIVLPDTGHEGAGHVARHLLECLDRQPVQIADHSIGVTAGIGISLYPDHGQDRDSLFKQAGAALRYAKNGGGNTYRFFTASMNVNTLERLQLETDLRHALERNELLLHYQPQIDLRIDRIVGVEALLRWQHPERGLVSPGQFIPIAEDSGLIVPIGEWVMREACRQIHAWQQAGLPRITVAVNLSALQFQRTDLLDAVNQALTECGLAPEWLELELTESILIQDTDNALRTVRQLRAMGLRLSIDDFGTGYSSLSYLQKLAVHTLKIDQSFVRGLASDADSAAIVRAVVQLAHSLKLNTIAEGVETDFQLAFLRNQGCDQVQGYYFSRPLPAVEFARLLAQNTLPVA